MSSLTSLHKPIKVAHFAEFAPHRCGLYHTVKDLIKAERLAGMEAAFFDVTVNKKKQIVTFDSVKWDGDFCTTPIRFAKDADILVRHSIIPNDLKNSGKSMVMTLHGRPESSFLLEHYGIRKVFLEELCCAKEGKYKAHIYYWSEYYNYWHKLLPDAKLKYIPAMVDLEEFTPEGQKYQFKESEQGEPNILILDMWRDDETPFNVLFAALKFAEKFPKAKIHLLGLLTSTNHVRALVNTLKRTGNLGLTTSLVNDVKPFFRACDMVVTPHVIATRVVREALACNCPVVAGSGNKYTPYTANPMDIKGFAEAIKTCWLETKDTRHILKDCRKVAEDNFSIAKAGERAYQIYNKILTTERSKKKFVSALKKVYAKNWGSDKEYQDKQKSKYEYIKPALEDWDEYYYWHLKKRVEPYDGITLCLGARQGTEVKAFRHSGNFAVGIDLKPGDENPYVCYGDFHSLEYEDNSIDIVFTNALDHVKDLDKFLEEVKRVMHHKSRFMLDINEKSTEDDKWASLFWDNLENIIKEIELRGFRLVYNRPINVKGLAEFTNMLIFKVKYENNINL